MVRETFYIHTIWNDASSAVRNTTDVLFIAALDTTKYGLWKFIPGTTNAFPGYS